MNSTPQEYTATIRHTEYLSPKVIRLLATPNKKIVFEPGQYASLFVDRDRQRLYSFASPSSTPYVEFLVDIEPDGPGSNYVKKLTINNEIRFLSPFGYFTLDLSSPRPLLFIATGTGIAPLKAHIEYLMVNQPTRKITLIFGNRDENHFILNDYFSKITQTHENFTYLPVLSKPSITWRNDRGRVTDVLLHRISHPAEYDTYICGNYPMVLATMTQLREKNVPDTQIHIESYT